MVVRETAQLVDALRREWESLDALERGDRLFKLKTLGCSTRGLEEQLGRSATSIRRHIELASLPDNVLQKISSGISKKKILAESARKRRKQRALDRVREDATTGKISDRIADEIFAFCNGDHGLPESPVFKSDLPVLLDEADKILQDFDRTARPVQRVSRRTSMKRRLRSLRPKDQNDEFWMAHRAEWLANLIWSLCTDRPIWKRALKKAEKRAPELQPKPHGPWESLRLGIERRAMITRPTGRPLTGSAQDVMKHQGLPPSKPK